MRLVAFASNTEVGLNVIAMFRKPEAHIMVKKASKDERLKMVEETTAQRKRHGKRGPSKAWIKKFLNDN